MHNQHFVPRQMCVIITSGSKLVRAMSLLASVGPRFFLTRSIIVYVVCVLLSDYFLRVCTVIMHYLPIEGIICILLPVTPTAMISIPIINSAIPKKIDTNTAPAKGDAITKKDIAMAKASAPMLNPLAQPGLWLLPIPYTTWEIPMISKPNPNINMTNKAVDPESWILPDNSYLF